MPIPFAERWAEKELALGFESIASTMISCGSVQLPTSAAPCMSFDYASNHLPICEVFASPEDWKLEDRIRLSSYRVIGTDGAGNPICTDQTNGGVVLLDHEDWFHTIEFVNSSVQQLAECLLAYMGEQDPDRFRKAVVEIDSAPMAENSFWWSEAACMESM